MFAKLDGVDVGMGRGNKEARGVSVNKVMISRR